MTNKITTGRRTIMKQLVAGLLGFLGWPAVKASAAGTKNGLFVNMFLQEGKSVQVPLGYYDPQSQRYLDSKTHKPIFTPAATGETAMHKFAAGSEVTENKQLSDKDLETLLKSSSFIDAMALEKMKAFGASCTASTLSSLSTTHCCPIVTDSTPDRVCDDTA